MKLKFSGLILLCKLLFSYQLIAQSLYPILIDEKVQRSTLIVEGKVLQQYSFWNETHTMIYTANTVEVYKSFKGKLQEQTLEVITVGGSVNGKAIHASDLLTLEKEQVGVFFLLPNAKGIRSPKTKKVLYDVYSSSQGFLHYDLNKNKASAPFVNFSSIEEQLYKTLTDKTKKSFETINSSFKIKTPQGFSQTLAHTVSSFTPTTVTAGAISDPVNNVLTITGTDFGTGSGSAAVIFDHADDGSGGGLAVIPFNHPNIIAWTNTQIQVRVPSEAGTGTLSVRDAAGVVESFSTPLTVLYSVLNYYFNFGAGGIHVKEANLMNTNGLGGYTIVYSTNTANSGVDMTSRPELATFQRALTTWKEVGGFAITEGGATTNQVVADDGLNTIMFDNTNKGVPVLSAGVLGVCYSYTSMCGPTSNGAQLTGFDIVIRNNGVSTGISNFTTGPCPPIASDLANYDLESVLLHELGHAIGLGHINDTYQGSGFPNFNPGKVMNYAILNGVRRTSPDYSAFVGASYLITPQGNSYGTCMGLFTAEMTPLTKTTASNDNCPVSFPSTAIASGTVVNFDLGHATSNRFSDPSYTQITSDASGTNVTNNAFYAFRTNSTGGSLDLTVSGYTTIPSALSSCPEPYGNPSKGVRLALYQVNSCPEGQSFPVPVACRNFSTNGPITTISGLAANTSYLLYVDGIENTKASFGLAFGGAIVLPLRYTSFKGNVMEDNNVLTWTATDIVDVEKLILQRSNNGIDFTDLASFTALKDMQAGSFKDLSPVIGNNFYRLITINNNQSKEYSSIVNLKKITNNAITLYPNPASDRLSIRLNQFGTGGKFSYRILNSIGQVVKEKQFLNSELTNISIAHFPKGIYQLTVQHNNEIVENLTFSIK